MRRVDMVVISQPMHPCPLEGFAMQRGGGGGAGWQRPLLEPIDPIASARPGGYGPSSSSSAAAAAAAAGAAAGASPLGPTTSKRPVIFITSRLEREGPGQGSEMGNVCVG